MVQKKNNGYLMTATKIMTSLLITAVIFITALIFILHSSYGLPFLQRSIEKLSDTRIQPSEFEYNLKKPFTFYFKNLSIESSKQKTYKIEELNLTFAPLDSLLSTSFVLKDAWLKGGSFIAKENRDLPLPKSLSIKELSLEKIDLQSEKFELKNADIQLTDWTNENDWGRFEGSFMFSAQSAKFADESFQEIIVNGIRQADEWDFWSLSLNTDFGHINTTATLLNNRLYFEQLSFSNANLLPNHKKQSEAFYSKLSPWLKNYQIYINRLDLLNIDAQLENSHIAHLNLTANNISIQDGKIKWQESKPTKFTFNAHSLGFLKWTSTEMLGNISVSKQGIDISTLTGKLANDGFLAIEGKLSPSAIELKDFTVNGLDFSLSEKELSGVEKYLDSLEKLSINKLAVKRTNLTMLKKNFPIFIKDISLKAQDFSSESNGKNRRYKGEIHLSADSANINQIQILAPIISGTMTDRQWRINSELPFENGQLKLAAIMNASSDSQPWQLEGEGISIPNNIYQQWFNAELPLEGEHDLDIDLNGLSITKAALRYSLTGSVNATLYKATLQPSAEQPLIKELNKILLSDKSPTTTEQENNRAENDFTLAKEKLDSAIALKAGKINIVFERGQLTLYPLAVSADGYETVLEGNWDFVTQQGGFSSK